MQRFRLRSTAFRPPTLVPLHCCFAQPDPPLHPPLHIYADLPRGQAKHRHRVGMADARVPVLAGCDAAAAPIPKFEGVRRFCRQPRAVWALHGYQNALYFARRSALRVSSILTHLTSSCIAWLASDSSRRRLPPSPQQPTPPPDTHKPKALVVDGNRANAELALDLQGLVSDYRFKQLTSWYQCRLLRLLWRRGGSLESFRWVFQVVCCKWTSRDGRASASNQRQRPRAAGISAW